MTETNITALFAGKFLALNYRDLPAAAIDMARQVVLDGLGVMVAGAREPLGVGRLSIEYVQASGGAEQSSVVQAGFKTSMQNAAYANGTMAHALDWDNTWYPLNHPTSPTLPAILAVAEHFQLPGDRIIEAVVTAFEVQGRLRLAATGLKTGAGFHKPGTTGIFGAVAGVARLLSLDLDQTLMALGLAGSRAGSMSINTGTMTKSSHSGHAARMGVECAILARMGWTASADVFGPKGFFDTFLHGDGEPEKLIEGFAAPLRMVEPGVGFKKYPSNYFTHRPIDAALALRQDPAFDVARIDRVEVEFAPFDYVNRPAPSTGLDGKFSVQYATLAALLDGEITVASFTNERRFAPDIQALLPRVKLIIDPSIPADFDTTHAIVKVWLDDGKMISRKVDRLSGWVGIPLTREQRTSKVMACVRETVSDGDAQRLIGLVERLEELDDVRQIMDIVRG
ncbi:MAG TPA: MmgE/PrpD family protein [Bordetella sp.]|nr:MmgE/PrpD family protein [Bordetella sp.]